MDGHINCKGGKVLKKEQTILEWLGINNKWKRSVLILQLIRCFVALPGGFFVIFSNSLKAKEESNFSNMRVLFDLLNN